MLPPLESAATHGGRFHADDVLAAALLVAAFPHIRIIRTRDPLELSRHPLIFDVGGVYDAGTLRLDHHFTPAPCRTDGTRLSSVGQLFQHHGRQLLQLAGAAEPMVDQLTRCVEHQVIRVVDAVDTGMLRVGSSVLWVRALTSERPQWDDLPGGSNEWGHALDEAFRRQVTTVARDVRRLCAQAAPNLEVQSQVASFTRALHLAAAPALARTKAATERARTAVVELLQSHPDAAQPLILPSPVMPWGRVWHEAERLAGVRVDQVIWRDPEGRWRLQSAWVAHQRGAARLPFPESWAGLAGETFIAASGIADAVFCHQDRLVAGFATRDGALAAARAVREMRRHAVETPRCA
jgi:uncharacterized UPF0160 family protein